MKYVLASAFSLLIVTAQVLWKQLAVKSHVELSLQYVVSQKFWHMIFSWQFLGGFLLYGTALFIYLALLSKYTYSSVQIITMPIALIVSLFAASLFFRETLSMVNMLGVMLLLFGMALATAR